MNDNGGRRSIIDRRKCTNFDHFPERRTLRFRRSDLDRRKGWAENSRVGIERRAIFRFLRGEHSDSERAILTAEKDGREIAGLG
jgi:hypothetical protein